MPSSPDRLASIQAMLFMAFAAGLLATVFALWTYSATKASASDQARLASDALMHSQRIGKAAPGAARGDVFSGTIDGLLNGHEVMQLTAVADPEMRAPIGEIDGKFSTYNRLVMSALDDLPRFTAAKSAELTIRYENEEVRKLLTSVQSGFDQRQDRDGIGFWIIAVAALLTAAAAAGIGMSMLYRVRT